MPNVIARLDDVTLKYGDRVVLRNCSLDVVENAITCIIGLSGAGKSTILRLLDGLRKPDAGHVYVRGQDICHMRESALIEMRTKIGFSFQFAALFDSMTVAENIRMGLLKKGGLSAGQMEARISESLSLVDLSGFENRFPAELSGGQRKRAGLARAIAYRPKYLLYDEPTSGLDPVTTTVIDRLIQRMKDELGVTSLVITHDMNSAYRISDRVAMLYEGRVVEVGTPDEIRASANPVVRSFVEGRPDLAHDAETPIP